MFFLALLLLFARILLRVRWASLRNLLDVVLALLNPVVFPLLVKRTLFERLDDLRLKDPLCAVFAAVEVVWARAWLLGVFPAVPLDQVVERTPFDVQVFGPVFLPRWL